MRQSGLDVVYDHSPQVIRRWRDTEPLGFSVTRTTAHADHREERVAVPDKMVADSMWPADRTTARWRVAHTAVALR